MTLGVLIVTHNSAKHIGDCLESCRARGLFESASVLVVDNASADATLSEVAAYPEVRLLANRKNLGFAAAANQGIHSLETDLVLLLNPDVVLQTPIDSMVRACTIAGAAACGGKLVGDHGRPQIGFQVRRFPSPASLGFEVLGINRLWPGNAVNRAYRCLDLDQEQAQRVEQPAGAFLLLRTSFWRDCGGFEESFRPLWFEDVDFLQRLAARGGSIWYVPDSIAFHVGAHSLSSVPEGKRQVYWYGSLLRYAERHFSQAASSLVALGVMGGLAPRVLTGIFHNRSFRSLSIYAKVFRIAGVYLLKGELPSWEDDGAHSPGSGWSYRAEQALHSNEEKIHRNA
jgi:N-acetylglucosaminyl-diphospho-decaprenol L-rhamnosyltransferase